MASPLLRVPGAVEAAGRDAGVAAHYGTPVAEQRALAGGRALVDLSHWGVLRVDGPDRRSWLNSLTSQKLDALAPGESAETLVLDAQGRIEFAAGVLDDGTSTYLVLDDAARAGALAQWLERMRFLLRVEVSADTGLVALGLFETDEGESALRDGLRVASPAGVPLVWRDPWREVASGGHQYAAQQEHPGAGWRFAVALVPAGTLDDLADAVVHGAAGAAGTLALEALRVAAWRPRAGLETDDRSIPHEVDWMRSAVHLAKGCYRGQETVAKVHNLGHPPRRLTLLHLDGSEGVLPEPGDEVLLGEKVIGVVTSSARHHEEGPLALALLKRTADAAATLVVRSGDVLVAANQQVVVPPEAGAVAGVPRLPRLGATRR